MTSEREHWDIRCTSKNWVRGPFKSYTAAVSEAERMAKDTESRIQVINVVTTTTKQVVTYVDPQS